MDTRLPATRRPRLVAALAVAAALAGCQPAQSPLDDEPTGAEGAPGGEDGMPGSLDELADRASEEAARWQEGSRLVEIRVELDGGDDDASWRTARATFVAPDAQRLLTVEWGPDGRGEHRPRLAGLGLSPVPAEALAGVPARPDGAREPGELAAAAEQPLAECDLEGPPVAVLYASGAPDAWDPERGNWPEPPEWSAAITNEGGAGVTLDPVTAEPQQPRCFGAVPTRDT